MSRFEIRTAINGTAKRLGFRISIEPTIETPFRSNHVPCDSRPGVIVEFLGPTCTGKSTFLRHLALTNDEVDGFSFVGERRRIRTESWLNRRVARADDFWRLLWELKSADIDSNQLVEHPNRVSASGLHRHILLREMAIRSLVSCETVLLDHSLTFFFRHQLQPLRARDPDAFRLLMERRIIAVCTTDPELNVERVALRRNTNFPSPVYAGKTLSESLEISLDLRRFWLKRADWLESVGVPVLRLDLGQPLDESKKQLKEFLAAAI